MDTPALGPVCVADVRCEPLLVGNGLTQHLTSPPLFAVTIAPEINFPPITRYASNALGAERVAQSPFRSVILGSISSVVLGTTAGEADVVLAFSCGRVEMTGLVLASVVGLAFILRVLFLSSVEQWN